MGIKIGGQIEKVNGRELSYSEFAERYLAKNQPVVLTGLMDDWGACKDWVSSNGQPNLHFFSTHFGKSKVQVADCGTREFTDQKRVEMSVLEFVNHWLQGSVEDLDGNGNGKSVLYLKDWHFVKEYPEYLAYKTPVFFTDDWLNFYLDNYRMHDDPDTNQENNDICCSDYRFVYMGAKGSWTPLHADVFRSYSWSANVCGKKKWLFLPPLQCHLLFDRNMKSSVYNIFDDISETKFSGFKKAIWMECIQEQNEIIFVPSGWYHQVHNLEDTISINHNWFNAYNLSWVWDLLLRDYKEAKEYIEDIKDICDNFEGLCQRNLAANTGMNFNDFFIFISRFSLANVVELYYIHNESKSKSSNRHWSDMVQHFAQNLASMRKIALKMKSEGGVQGNLGILDLRESLSDPKFLKLCSGLGRIYAVIHEQENWSCTMRKVLMAEFENYGSRVCSPEDLVKFIDYAVSKLSGNGTEQNTLLSVLYDAQPRQQN
ncbi:PREDICTED: jmjC domain-containing protein 4 isoform X1 [Theobroma cacao]|uniref:JmjC domain-containing protein 4 isoform X1 n=1 Tax=Theobroma cacao TaxID=3641 RepID=A0AB32VB71_THECC|nr:PREDICTED: jmjC domain-containing protein 4 isoform X1 [Theobroma cacao]